MRNRHTSICQTFFRKTFDYGPEGLLAEGHGEEGSPDEPFRFKLYQHTPHYALEHILPLECSPASEHQTLDPTTLSLLLFSTYGLARVEQGWDAGWPYHRFVPSARCFFPVELYFWLPEQVNHIPAGYYHYDPLHHRLALLRPGGCHNELQRALNTDLTGSLGVILLSALFWKNAFRYYNFAYRLAAQEAGMVAGNACLVAEALGLQGHVQYQFLDQPINRLLGFEAYEESLFAALSLYPEPRQRQRLTGHTMADTLLGGIAPLAPVYKKRGALDRLRCSLLIELDQYSMLECTDEFVSDISPDQPSCSPGEQRIAPQYVGGEPVALSRALQARNSGDVFFAPFPLPLEQPSFWNIINAAMKPYTSDLHSVCARPFLQLYLVINHIIGIQKGVYRFCTHCGLLHVIDVSDPSMHLQELVTQVAINCASANMVCYIVGDHQAASSLLGNRSYRILHMESGLIAQRLCVVGASYGLVARCSDSYHIERCRDLLHLANCSDLPLFQIVIGHERPGARYRQSLFL